MHGRARACRTLTAYPYTHGLPVHHVNINIMYVYCILLYVYCILMYVYCIVLYIYIVFYCILTAGHLAFLPASQVR